MRYKNKRRIVSILAAIFAAVIFITVPASALEWNGTTGGGNNSAGTSSNGGYAVYSTDNQSVMCFNCQVCRKIIFV